MSEEAAREQAKEIVTTPHPNLVLTQLDEEILIDRLHAALREREREARAIQHVCTKCGYVAVTQYGNALKAQLAAAQREIESLKAQLKERGE